MSNCIKCGRLFPGQKECPVCRIPLRGQWGELEQTPPTTPSTPLSKTIEETLNKHPKVCAAIGILLWCGLLALLIFSLPDTSTPPTQIQNDTVDNKTYQYFIFEMPFNLTDKPEYVDVKMQCKPNTGHMKPEWFGLYATAEFDNRYCEDNNDTIGITIVTSTDDKNAVMFAPTVVVTATDAFANISFTPGRQVAHGNCSIVKELLNINGSGKYNPRDRLCS